MENEVVKAVPSDLGHRQDLSKTLINKNFQKSYVGYHKIGKSSKNEGISLDLDENKWTKSVTFPPSIDVDENKRLILSQSSSFRCL